MKFIKNIIVYKSSNTIKYGNVPLYYKTPFKNIN